MKNNGNSVTISNMPSSELSVMFCYVYLLRSEEGNHMYVGFTHNLRQRFAEHNKGLNQSTKAYAPWELLYYEAHRSEADARRREHYLKTTAGDRAIKKMIREQLHQSIDLSQQKVYY